MITVSPSTFIGRDYSGMDDPGAVNEIAVVGNGFLVVRDPATNKSCVTQTGNFNLDSHGCLVNPAGARLQGRTSGASSAMGDIQVNAAGLPAASAPGASMVCYTIDARGKISVHLSDGTSFFRAQIMLQNFRDPEALVSEGDNLYSNLSAAGPLPAMEAPRSHGLGAIQWGVLELARDGSSNWKN